MGLQETHKDPFEDNRGSVDWGVRGCDYTQREKLKIGMVKGRDLLPNQRSREDGTGTEGVGM